MNRFMRFASLAFVFLLMLVTPLVAEPVSPGQPATVIAVLDLPVATTISPVDGVRGTRVSVTLTGDHFEGPTSINAGSGITASNVSITGTTTLTADFDIAATASLGIRNVTVTSTAGTSGPVTFTVLPPAPALAGISPSSGALGSKVNVTLQGTDFVSGMTLSAGSDITVRSLSISSSTLATATLIIDTTAALGARDLTVTTAGGSSNAFSFNVILPPPPVLSNVSPAVGVPGSSVPVTLSGENFISGMSIDPIDGISVSIPSVTSSNTATATFVIAADAALGSRPITVTTVGGTSSPASFTVTVIPPILTGISPSTGVAGGTLTVTLSGINLVSGMTIDTIPGITVSSINVTSSNSATATFAIDAAADLGPRNIRVVTANGVSGTLVFSVVPPAPTLSAITPASTILGTSVFVILTGTNFAVPFSIALNSDIEVSEVAVLDSATATAKFTVGLGASPGQKTVTITTPGGSASAALFTVIPFPPTLTAISPSSVVQGTLARSFVVTLTGTNFFEPSVSISGSGVRAPSNLLATSGTTATAIFTVDANADVGPRSVTVSNAGGTSNEVVFSVLPPVPTLTTVTPAVGVRGTSVNVTLGGTNFASGATLGNIPGVTISNVNVVTAVAMTATLTIDASATLGNRNITVTTAQGTSNAVSFAVADSFPDLSIASSHATRFGVAFEEAYLVTVSNVGTRVSSGAITVNDTLPQGLTFVSGIGTAWSCSATGQDVTCTNSLPLAAGSSSAYTLTVAVDSSAAGTVNHVVTVSGSGDVNPANNIGTDPTIVIPVPAPFFEFNKLSLVPGEQATVTARVVSSFPHDITGSVTMSFASSAVIPVDDPAIQFATGGRSVTFTIPANSTQAQFGSASDATPLGFQPGTVAGRIIFNGTFKVGTTLGNFAPTAGSTPTIASAAPTIESIETTTQGGFAVLIQLSSTPREITAVTLVFNTSPKVKLSCGTAVGCSANGNVITFDVASLFSAWYQADETYGSLSVLKLPLSIAGGNVRGTVDVQFANRQGVSNVKSFNLQ